MILSDNAKKTIFFWFVSIVAMAYFAGIVMPYGSGHGFMGDGDIPPKQFVPTYLLLTLPAYITYIVYTFLNFKKLRLRTLTYPLIIFNFYVGMIYCLVAMGGVFIWLLVFTIVPLFILMLISLIIGLVLDIRSRKKDTSLLQ